MTKRTHEKESFFRKQFYVQCISIDGSDPDYFRVPFKDDYFISAYADRKRALQALNAPAEGARFSLACVRGDQLLKKCDQLGLGLVLPDMQDANSMRVETIQFPGCLYESRLHQEPVWIRRIERVKALLRLT
jgi:hypothetical protein